MSGSQPDTDLQNLIGNLDDGDRLLLRSAATMRKYARKYCRLNYLAGNKSNCEWYHAPWQYCRLVGLVSTPDLHADFYAQSFTDACSPCVHDILICGTADYGILDHLARAIPKNLIDNVTISILDLCQTPLQICKWYARWYEDNFNIHLKLRYNQGDALNTGYQNHTFDMITTYQFIARFGESEQKKLIDEWYRLLKPGGRVITSDNISPKHKLNKIVAVGGEVDFVRRVTKCIDEKKSWLRPMTKTISNLAYEYARSQAFYSIPSKDYLFRLFENFSCTIESAVIHSNFEGEKQFARIMAIKK